MAFDALNRPTLLLIADRLEAEARALPRWDVDSAEPWHELVERQYEADHTLARQLRGLPGCQLEMCSSRQQVRLGLLGIRVQTHQGLGQACLLWVARVRAQLATPEEPAG